MIINETTIFVFGSNEAGIHGAGAAKVARIEYGAVMDVGVGRTGNCYAIPTKDHKIKTISLSEIRRYVNDFLAYATENPHLTFIVTQIGCGLAGYHAREIAPMFRGAPDNCQFDTAWSDYLPHHKTWGGYD